MKICVQRVIWSALVFATLGWSSSAEQFQCKNEGGCPASITTGGRTHRVVFRKGDLVDTDSGWDINPGDGWKKS